MNIPKLCKGKDLTYFMLFQKTRIYYPERLEAENSIIVEISFCSKQYVIKRFSKKLPKHYSYSNNDLVLSK